MNPFLNKSKSGSTRWSSAYRAIALLVIARRKERDKGLPTAEESRRKLAVIEAVIAEVTVSEREGRYGDHLPTWTFDPARDFKDGVLTDSVGLNRENEGSVGMWALRAEFVLQGLGYKDDELEAVTQERAEAKVRAKLQTFHDDYIDLRLI